MRDVATLFESSVDTESLSDKQKAVLKASLTLFAKQGYEATSTHDIAALAHVAEGTVYKVFKTKEGLLAAIMKPFMEEVLPQVVAEFVSVVDQQQITDLKTTLTFMIHDRLVFAMDSRREIKVFAQMVLSDPDLLKVLGQRAEALVKQHYDQLMKPLQASGQLVDWPPMRVLRYVAGTLLSYALPVILMDGAPLDVDAVTAECVDFLCKGLAA